MSASSLPTKGAIAKPWPQKPVAISVRAAAAAHRSPHAVGQHVEQAGPRLARPDGWRRWRAGARGATLSPVEYFYAKQMNIDAMSVVLVH
jgi:hypothetical protein